MVVNDVSERAFQMERGGQWVKGKSAETFNPAGPWLVTPDEIDDVRDLDLWLDVNGVRRQTGNTATMVFDPYFLVHYLSQFLVLEPGDLINTGTPPGVGMGFDPPIWLQPGDVMELGIDGAGRAAPARARSAVTDGMRAFVRHRTGRVRGAGGAAPRSPAPGEAVVDVERVGVCGTDVEFFTGEMAYLHQGHARFPMRLGHEWCGTVTAVGRRRRPGLGRSPGDGRHDAGRRRLPPLPARATSTCARTGRRSASAAAVPAPWPSSWPSRSARCTRCRTRSTRSSARWSSRAATPCAPRAAAGLQPGDRVLVLGPGTIGLLVGDVRPGGRRRGAPAGPLRGARWTSPARSASTSAWTADTLPDLPFDAVIDASNAPHLPARALDLVEPAGRVVYIGLAGTPEPASTPGSLALKDVTAVGILSASPGLDATIEAYADGAVDPRPLVAATVGLDQVGAGPGRATDRTAPDPDPRSTSTHDSCSERRTDS